MKKILFAVLFAVSSMFVGGTAYASTPPTALFSETVTIITSWAGNPTKSTTPMTMEECRIAKDYHDKHAHTAENKGLPKGTTATVSSMCIPLR
ncbi:MAG: hypothetical protein AAB628_01480 [Patescibacteria group bacterium]